MAVLTTMLALSHGLVSSSICIEGGWRLSVPGLHDEKKKGQKGFLQNFDSASANVSAGAASTT